MNFDASKWAKFVKKLHDRARANIEKMTKIYEKRATKGRKKTLVELGDLFGVHSCKDHFPKQHKSKLQPRADGPFKVLHKINDNTYEIDLPSTYGVSTSFNVVDLSPFFGLEELRMTPFQEGEDDEDIPAVHVSSSPKDTNQGPLTRSHAKKLQEQVNSFLTECNFNTYENVILPKCHILMMLRFTHEDVEGTWPKDQDTVLQNSSIRKVTRTDDRTRKK